MQRAKEIHKGSIPATLAAFFQVRDNCLHVGEIPITALAERAEGRAFYAYDRRIMSASVARLRRALPDDLQLHYAVKANPLKGVVDHLADETDGLDVASSTELQQALATGTPASDISFAGPGKSLADLTAAVDAGVVIVLESLTEMRRVAELAEQKDKTPIVALRVNPDFTVRNAGMVMGGGPRPFGIDAEDIQEAISEASRLPLDLVGLHIFAGSQNLNCDALCDIHSATTDLAIRLATGFPRPLRWLNIGGGLGVPYFPGQQPVELQPVADNLHHCRQRLRESFPGATVVMELGRYLVAEAGVYACQVTDRKVSRGQTYLVVNGGLHHHLALSGNFGQVIRRNYPLCIATRIDSTERETVTIVGPLCTPLDVLGEGMDLPRAEIGDWIAVFQSGAYGFSASPHDFLGHPRPAEILL